MTLGKRRHCERISKSKEGVGDDHKGNHHFPGNRGSKSEG